MRKKPLLVLLLRIFMGGTSVGSCGNELREARKVAVLETRKTLLPVAKDVPLPLLDYRSKSYSVRKSPIKRQRMWFMFSFRLLQRLMTTLPYSKSFDTSLGKQIQSAFLNSLREDRLDSQSLVQISQHHHNPGLVPGF